MPFVQRQVYPVHLAGREIPENVENPLECVSNQTLCDAMRQLASLLKHADTMFSDLELNCGQISTRTQKLKDRLTILDENVEKYNPKKEKIPAGDLVEFSRLKNHYKREYVETKNLFQPDSRPISVHIMYQHARNTTTQVEGREEVSYVCVPIFSSSSSKQKFKNFEVETQQFSDSFRLTVRGKLPKISSDLYAEISKFYEPLPHRRYGTLPAVQDSQVVKVDVSGRNFDSMTEFRRSLQPVQQRRRKKKRDKRRNTLGGGTEHSQDKIYNKRSKSVENSRCTQDVDVSMDVDPGSSLATTTIPDLDLVSLSSSYLNKTLSDIVLPPPPPENKSGEQMKKLKSLDRRNPFLDSDIPFLDSDIPFLDQEPNPFLSQGRESPFSDQDAGQESYYESMRRNHAPPFTAPPSSANPFIRSAHPDGALSSSGVWTNSGSDQDKDEYQCTPRVVEDTTPRVLARPVSSLSMGVISDHSELGGEESSIKVQDGGEEEGERDAPHEYSVEDISIHSCDTEGYYTTFHDFDGFQEVTQGFSTFDTVDTLKIVEDFDPEGTLKLSKEGTTMKDGVVLRAKKRRPPPPSRTSSLYKDRESIDTVVHVSELQQYDIIFSEPNQTSSPNQTRAAKQPVSPNRTPTKENQLWETKIVKTEQMNIISTPVTVHVTDLDDSVQNNSADFSRASEDDNSFWESDFENSQHSSHLKHKAAILSRPIPSICAVTPPLSDDDRRSSSREKERLDTSTESETIIVYGQPIVKSQILSGAVYIQRNLTPERRQDLETFSGNAGDCSLQNPGNIVHDTSKERIEDKEGSNRSSEVVYDELKNENKPEKVEPETEVDGEKVVSITPDIVKPNKPSDNSMSEPENNLSLVDTDSKTNSSSRLPDMLTHTPDAGFTNSEVEKCGNAGVEGIKELVGVSGGGANTQPTVGTVGCVWGTEQAESRQSVKTIQQENSVPKLRITSPFTSYRRSEEKESSPENKDWTLIATDDKDSPPPLSAPVEDTRAPLSNPATPLTLSCPPYQAPPSPYSGVLNRSLGDVNKSKEASNTPVSPTVQLQVSGVQLLAANPEKSYHPSQPTNPSQEIIRNLSLSKPSEGNDIMTPKSEEKKSSKSLSRSDSYRRARPLLSPVEVRKNRNSCDATTLDLSSINIQNEKEEKKEAKGNFFKNIRSQFTFSSLRRKSPKKSSNKEDSYRTSGCDPTHDLSPSVGSRMTSTPLSSCATARVSEQREVTEEVKYRTAAMKNQHQRWSFAEQTAREGLPNLYTPGPDGYIYSNPPAHLPPHQHPRYYPQPIHPQHPQYHLQHQPQHIQYPQYHLQHQPQHVQHQPQHVQHQLHPAYGYQYGTYGSSSTGVYAQNMSKRSSIASLAAVEQGFVGRSPNPSVYEGGDEGAYGYSVGRGSTRSTPLPPYAPGSNRSTPLPPPSSGGTPLPHPRPELNYPPNLSNCPTPLLHLEPNLLRKSCECPMCYHSINNPCPTCGCPNNTVPKAMKLNPRSRGHSFTDQQSTVAFFSPSSDYYSLSPDSPPPTNLNQSPEPNPNNPQSLAQHQNGIQNGSPQEIHQNVNLQNSQSPNSDSDKSFESRKSSPSSSKSKSPDPRSHPPRRPSQPERPAPDKLKGNRRHSWAGDKGKVPPPPKQTSLQEFKKLLSQQAGGPNQHRISAKELLLSSENKSSQNTAPASTAGGSLRKKSPPWRDQRFSIIQEEDNEENRKSRENLCD